MRGRSLMLIEIDNEDNVRRTLGKSYCLTMLNTHVPVELYESVYEIRTVYKNEGSNPAYGEGKQCLILQLSPKDMALHRAWWQLAVIVAGASAKVESN